MLIWPWHDPRSRSRGFWISKNCTFLHLSSPPFWCGAQNWRLIMIVWDQLYSMSEPSFWISFSESYHVTSNFAECQYLHEFQRVIFPYCLRLESHGRFADSPICVVHADVTLTPSKVKVTGLLNFQKLHFSTSLLSTVLAWSSKLMVDYDGMHGT